jgi:hypothetical protein
MECAFCMVMRFVCLRSRRSIDYLLLPQDFVGGTGLRTDGDSYSFLRSEDD